MCARLCSCLSVHVFMCVHLYVCVCVCMRVSSRASGVEGLGSHGLNGLRQVGLGAQCRGCCGCSAGTYRRWESRGAAAGRSQPARTGCGSSSCICHSRGPWCYAHTRTAGCPHARSTGWRAGCTCTWGDTEGQGRQHTPGQVARAWEAVGAAGLEGILEATRPTCHDSPPGQKKFQFPSHSGNNTSCLLSQDERWPWTGCC